MANLFKIKPLETLLHEANSNTSGLKRQLTSFNLIMLGIGAIIGAGLFSLTGIVAAEYAGPGVTFSFMFAALGCAFAGLCYAEFASMIPIAGSAYTYAYTTMGEFVAWIIGWALVLEYALGAATVSISWSQYLNKFLNHYNLEIPPRILMSPFESVTMADGSVVSGIINLPAIFIIVLLSLVLIRGTKESATMNNFLVILKVSVVLVFIAIGWSYIDPVNHTPYIPENTGEFGKFGFSGILRGAGVVFFAFIGFDAVSTAAQEAKNPQKGMPIGILGSLIICTILYVLFSHVMTGVANYKEFAGSAAPVVIAVEKMHSFAWLNQTVKIAILAGYTSVMLVMLMGQSRVFYTMSNDGLLPKMFSTLHPKFSTPYKCNLFFAVFVSIFSGFVPIKVVGELVSMGTLFAFVLVCIGVLIMRKTRPDIKRPFRTPFVPLVPILGVITCGLLMAALPGLTWLNMLAWMAIGIVIYFSYGIKNSKLQKES